MATERRAHGPVHGAPSGRLAEHLGVAHLRAPAGARTVSVQAPLSGARIVRGMGLAIVAALLLVASPARAHDVSYSYADLVLGPGGCRVRLTVHRNDAARLIAV